MHRRVRISNAMHCCVCGPSSRAVCAHPYLALDRGAVAFKPASYTILSLRRRAINKYSLIPITIPSPSAYWDFIPFGRSND
ncbi:hypothetical protein EVAR_55453_1 [Eumeta japonica]|uniref:Uncharacterized protein n=1 Tax=Eumeta variegata TaxID=151549 RepID=A0A4C1Y436_EUMVA|nr:hypothetical protein EVAR_55453_1 [Eumeta japonica]